MKAMQKISVIAIFAAMGSVALNTSAAECYRSTECEGDLICVNLTCVASEEPLSVCSEEVPCSYDEICDQGVCKPDGVTCANEYGQCTYDSGGSICRCDSGEGVASDVACDDGADCEVEVVTDEELYKTCTDDVSNYCEAPPDLTAVCTDEQMTTCTAMLTTMNALDQNCGSSTTPVDIDTETPLDSDGFVDVETDASSGEDAAGGTDGSAESPAAGGAETYEPNAYEMADCCGWIEAETDPGDLTYFDCIVALAPDDCEGYAACEAEDISIGKDDDTDASGDADIDNDTGESADGDTEADTEIPADVDDADADTTAEADQDGNADTEDSETSADAGDDTDTADETDDNAPPTETTQKASGGGCSFVLSSGPADAFLLINLLLE